MKCADTGELPVFAETEADLLGLVVTQRSHAGFGTEQNGSDHKSFLFLL
jgi:hypothetical protein